MAMTVLLLLSLGLAMVIPMGAVLAEDAPPTITVEVDAGSKVQTVHVAFSSDLATVSGTVSVKREYIKPEQVDLTVEGTDWDWIISPARIDVNQRDQTTSFTATTTVPEMNARGVFVGKVTATWWDSLGENHITVSDEFQVTVENEAFKVTANPNYLVMEPGQTRQVSVTIEDLSFLGLTYLCQVGDVTSPEVPPWLDRAQFWLDVTTVDIDAGDSESVTLEIFIPTNVSSGILTVPVVVTVDGHPEHTQHVDITVNVQGVPIAPPGGGGGEDGFPVDPEVILWISLFAIAIGLVGFLGFTEVGMLAVFWTLLLPLFTRLRRKEVLNQFTRGEIYGFIQANPGIHLTAIKENLGLANGVLAYHLKVLVREEFIVVRREGGYKRFYPRDMKVPRKRVHFTRLQLDIVEKLHLHPGLTQAALARMLGESKQVINYNISVLLAADVVRVEREGGKTLCYVKDGASIKPQMAELVEEDEEDAGPAPGIVSQMKM